MQGPSTGLASYRLMHFPAGMLMPEPSFCPAFRSHGDLSSTRLPAAACPCLSQTGPVRRHIWSPSPRRTTGAQFDPLDIEEMCQTLAWLTLLTEDERRSMGRTRRRNREFMGP